MQKELEEVSKIEVFNKIGEYARNKGFDVAFFKSKLPRIKPIDFEGEIKSIEDIKMAFEYVYVDYIHIYKSEGNLLLSIYFDDCRTLSAVPNVSYYEMFDMSDVARFIKGEEELLFSEAVSFIDKSKY